ncbi:MAG: hypothetical protein GVY16_10395 [Planctomycetes bacterium]|jgi:hypothetical protein|nr:hypothetical protein [Phycisphaerae bacterium]NBB96131.1 hypothetical protein [Planctomycetota bacterium]
MAAWPVDMKCSAFRAVAAFRGVLLLYAGDSLASDEWALRGSRGRAAIRETLLELAIEACLRL